MSEQAQVVTIDGKEYKQEDLTQEQIRLFNKTNKWQGEAHRLKDALGEDEVKSIEDSIASQIAEKKTPTTASGVSW